MLDLRRRPICPECGNIAPHEATLCPHCGNELSIYKESELCPACGARILISDERCSICGASRRETRAFSRANTLTIGAGALAIVALLVALWLTKPWNALSLTEELVEALIPTDTPDPTFTHTPTFKPTPTPTFTATYTPPASATPLPPSPTPTVAEPLRHVVAKGENLGTIARKYGVTAESIAQANNLTINAILRIGQELIIPGQTAPTPTPQPPSGPPPFLNVTPPPTPTRPVFSTPSSTDHLYPKPLLLSPPNGSIIAGRSQVILNWTAVGILGDSEWYLVRLWRSEEDPDPLRIWTKATSWRLPKELYPKGEISCHFLWQVTVMTRTSDDESGVAISPASERYEFCWR